MALNLMLAVPSHVFLIAATNTFIRFICFRFGSHYNEYIDAAKEPSQRVLVDDRDKDTFVYMSSTQWFNLESPVGRRSALCHVLALVSWHHEQAAMDSDDSFDSEDDDDLMDENA